ncbi:hypothetical protein [Mariniflexile sp. HMF6888]|uniref:hypothetical protein n=1 Tax=Mariniflexile sp. HMF6888 TaxID=3373086 RepID=UPI00378FB566
MTKKQTYSDVSLSAVEDIGSIVFNLNNSPKALLRGVQFTSPLEERSELPFRAVLGEVKYKISVFEPEIKMKQAKYLYGSASRIVCFKKFFIRISKTLLLSSNKNIFSFSIMLYVTRFNFCHVLNPY